MALFVLNVVFTDDIDKRLATRPIHREFLQQMLDKGTLHESGPFSDDSGALMIYNVASLAEAQFAADPYSITGGIVESVTFNEWNRVFDATP